MTDFAQMTSPLYQTLSPALTTLFGSIDGHAKAGAAVFCGSPGSVTTRKNQKGVEYYVHRYYDGAGVQRERYLGLVADALAEAEALRAKIDEAKALIPDLRLLAREGFQVVDAKTYATLASLHVHGLFAAGATLVGSHAFGVLLNQMGVRAAAYATEDIDIARREMLAFASPPAAGFLEMLRGSGINFVEVPQLDVRAPSTSFKQQGMSRFHVDLLVPSADAEILTVPVPELQAHATALPYLAYVLEQASLVTLISREGCCPVRVPVAERYAIHKLVVSQLRTSRDAKTDKDIFQAAVLLAALGDKFPGVIEVAILDLPKSARRYLTRAVPLVLERLGAHPRAMEEIEAAVAARVRKP